MKGSIYSSLSSAVDCVCVVSMETVSSSKTAMASTFFMMSSIIELLGSSGKAAMDWAVLRLYINRGGVVLIKLTEVVKI